MSGDVSSALGEGTRVPRAYVPGFAGFERSIWKVLRVGQ